MKADTRHVVKQYILIISYQSNGNRTNQKYLMSLCKPSPSLNPVHLSHLTKPNSSYPNDSFPNMA